ncbi:hypothetical protein KSP40_PGU015434 [Platanthera guangdongensis]|uniref:Uncharacterized protein n=1 Tax=Platanthera guangdongensis TaxID=2320717 RepID=A0ABR2MVS3_9ASPA
MHVAAAATGRGKPSASTWSRNESAAAMLGTWLIQRPQRGREYPSVAAATAQKENPVSSLQNDRGSAKFHDAALT